jgi:non-heme chloroperoxidase
MNQIITRDGTEIYYKDWGEGPVVAFSHGWPLNSDAWDGQMLFLAKNGFRVVAHDRRGHGRSSQASSGNDMNGYADDLAAVMEALDLRDVTLVGHSTGGGEVVRYIGRHGSRRVAKAALVAAVPPMLLRTDAHPEGLPIELFDGLRAALANDRSQFYKDFAVQFYGANRPDAKVSQGVLDQFWLWSMQSGLKNSYESIKAFSETDFTEDLQRIDVPTLSCTARTTRSFPSMTLRGGRRNLSRTSRRSTTRVRRTASRPPIKTGSTPTCWPSCGASQHRRQPLLRRPPRPMDDAVSPSTADAVDRIAVAGAGYAGLHVALRLTGALRHHPGVHLTLVDRHDYHQVLTELPRVAGGTRAVDAVRLPLEDVLAHRVRFVQTEISGFDLPGRRLLTDAGPAGWSRLVLALGSRPNDFAIPGLDQRALSVYSASDAERAWAAVNTTLEEAAATGDPERRRRLATVVVGGGGATGVELAGELAEMLP